MFNIMKTMKNKAAWAWLGVSVASFLFFIYGLVMLISGIIQGGEVKKYSFTLAGSFFEVTLPTIGFGVIIVGIIVLFWGITQTVHNMSEDVKRVYRNLGTAYTYISPAIIGMVVLVFFPLVFGIWVAFTNFSQDIRLGNENFVFPTLERFKEVFTSQNSDFWNVFFVNIWWTVINIVLSVAIGVILALILNRKDMKFKKIYRTLLILPWAVPSYVTALMWKAMFQQAGPINQIFAPVYSLFGIKDGFKWLSQSYLNIEWLRDKVPVLGAAIVNMFSLKGYMLSLPFIAVVTVNVWLGFPFMMVVALGGLQSISETYYEAAEIDGATKWQQFKFITAPLLKPTMIPAIILSIIWTFNQFNVIYLVTDQDKMSILVVSAYREAFEKGRYSYAAAYSVIIFIILALYSIFTMKVSKASEEVY